MMWERVAEIVSARGSQVLLNTKTVNILWSDAVPVSGFRPDDQSRSLRVGTSSAACRSVN